MTPSITRKWTHKFDCPSTVESGYSIASYSEDKYDIFLVAMLYPVLVEIWTACYLVFTSINTDV